MGLVGSVERHRSAGLGLQERSASIAPVRTVAIAGPRGGKAWPRLLLGQRSLPSRYSLTPAISRHARRVLPYAAGALPSFNSAAAVDMDNMEVVD